MSGFKFKFNPTPLFTPKIQRVFCSLHLANRSRRCVLAHHRCVINQQYKSLESKIGHSAVARANEVRRHQPKEGEQ